MTETLPTPSPTTTPNDADTVAAVRAGDTDRFQELVERHADRVYAVAWCRLGDRTLAEEAAQEAFILGFRRLSLLGHADRFGAWITAIARRTAINLGLRHRRELSKRQAWAEDAVESIAEPPLQGVDEPDLDLPTALQALPPIHRECLALFYLERQSITAAAASLNISESALKVRLHRARHALRDLLADQIESNLATLRAPTRLVRSVMLALPAAATPLGTLGTLAATLAQALPFGASLFILKIVCQLPGLFLAHQLGRMEARNYRQDDTFRRLVHGRLHRRLLVFIGVTTASIMLFSATMPLRAFAGVFGALSLASVLQGLRQSRVVRHPGHLATTLALALIAIPLCAMAWPGTPFWILSVGQAGFFLVCSWIIPRQPPRMDFSLFARAFQNSLESPPAPPSEADPRSRPMSRANLLDFARFLGRQMLVEDWHWEQQTLVLTLPKVTPVPFMQLVPPRWLRTSWICLEPSGTVHAKLGDPDALELSRIARLSEQPAPPAAAHLESHVAHAVHRAWCLYATHPDRALLVLGVGSTETLFQAPHEKTASTRLRVWILRLTAVLVVAGAFLFFPRSTTSGPDLASNPPSAEAIRSFLDRAATHTPPASFPFRWEHALDPSTDPCPPRNWFTPGERASLLSSILPATWPTNEADRALTALLHSKFLALWLGNALAPEEIPEAFRDQDALRRGVRALSPDTLKKLLIPLDHPVQDQPYRMLFVREVVPRLEWLAHLGVLGELDLEPLVQAVLQSQIPHGASLPMRWPVPPNHELDGLFVLMIADPLRDTRDALRILQLAGRLESLDREATIQGILRLHRGRGLFAPKGLDPSLLVQGQATHTLAAWDSLRMLQALDRVRDLETWQFRFPRYTALDRVSPDQPSAAWPAIQAALIQRAVHSSPSLPPKGVP
ncbi:MAG: sigma-70 family RNA polymerase sigma factor, partial [Verrucomicrobiales bacterium]|nr:sigma-70 family RNA polymerase sigma factor [Verrucomicrobiales bacterium]